MVAKQTNTIHPHTVLNSSQYWDEETIPSHPPNPEDSPKHRPGGESAGAERWPKIGHGKQTKGRGRRLRGLLGGDGARTLREAAAAPCAPTSHRHATSHCFKRVEETGRIRSLSAPAVRLALLIAFSNPTPMAEKNALV